MSEKLANFGMIGLGVMGRNLALNVSDHGFRVAVWNLEPEVTDVFVKVPAGACCLAILSTSIDCLKLAR